MNAKIVPRVTCEELKQSMDKGEKVVVIDIRKTDEYNLEHIKGAVNICYDPLGDPQEREMRLSVLPQDTLLVFYCDCLDESTSSIMVLELRGLRYDFDKVKALRGGFPRWRMLGYPAESA